jgi:hypothetical protein
MCPILRFLVERIVSFNVFGCPISSLDSHNTFLANKKATEKPYGSCGIWTLASYINHNCSSNARRAFIGDMMVVRATRDLEPGTEVTFWYHSPQTNDAKALKEKLKHWGFVCDCAICIDSSKTKAAVVADRKRLMEQLKPAFENPRGIQTDKVERLLDALNASYKTPATEVPRLLLWDPQLGLTNAYYVKKNMGKALESAVKTLASLGFIVVGADSSSTRFAVVKWGLMIDVLVKTFLLIRNALVAIGAAAEDSILAERCARTMYRILVGEDSSFDATYG